MAENKEGQEKTEEASSKRLGDARDRGQVAKSTDITTLFMLVIGMAGTFTLGGHSIEKIMDSMRSIFSNIATIDMTDANAVNYITDFVWLLFIVVMPLVVIAWIAAFLGDVSQVKLKFAPKKFTEGLNFKQVFNPFSGLKKIMISKHSLFELTKSFIKLIILGTLIYSVLSDYSDQTILIIEKPIEEIGRFMVDVSIDLLKKVLLAFAVISAADYFYQKRKFKTDMMMTKQETKEETKQMQGDPQVKARFRGLMRSRIMSLMMQNLKAADVVVTNPTHFAVAIKYDPQKANAPYIVAKGADFMAAKIREQANEYDIPIVENPPLARTLYWNVDINQEVPEELFKTVAEVLAFVYNMKKDKRKIS